ncbi:MAG: YciI family protein [Actinobacteria bacterium]|nr:YciI family protein [Actinomycetota bacterium]
MRFMIIRRADADTEAGVMPTEELLTSMFAYNQRMLDAGILVSGDGLHPTSNATRVRIVDGTPTFTDGPFTDIGELIAGFTMIRVDSREEALNWLRQWPEPNVDLELRQVFEAADFGDEFTPELREQEERMREQAAQNA